MYGPEAFDDDPMWDESVDGPDVDASDELRHALPAYANKAISDIDAARIPADASGQIAAVQIALRPPYCDEIFGGQWDGGCGSRRILNYHFLLSR